MRIVETSLTRTSATRRTERRSTASSGFGALVDATETDSSASAGPVGAAMALSSLLMLQTVEDSTSAPNQQAADHGRALLDDLEGLQRELALGGGSMARLQDMAGKLKAQTRAGIDARLCGILDQIELRVAVELAKRGCAV